MIGYQMHDVELKPSTDAEIRDRRRERAENTRAVDNLRHATYGYTAPPHTDLPHKYFEEEIFIVWVGRSLGKSTTPLSQAGAVYGGDYLFQIPGMPLARGAQA